MMAEQDNCDDVCPECGGTIIEHAMTLRCFDCGETPASKQYVVFEKGEPPRDARLLEEE
jgi:hypothetical protein